MLVTDLRDIMMGVRFFVLLRGGKRLVRGCRGAVCKDSFDSVGLVGCSRMGMLGVNEG